MSNLTSSSSKETKNIVITISDDPLYPTETPSTIQITPTLIEIPLNPPKESAAITPSNPLRRKYEELKREIRPFDLVLFKGADFISNSIRRLQKMNSTRGEFSHIGMVINTNVLPAIKNSRADEWYIWESTMSGQWNDGVPDVETGNGYFGTQIRCLDAVVRAYSDNPETDIAIVRLLNNPVDRRAEETEEVYEYRMRELREKINDVYEQYNHRRYDASPVNLLSTIVPCCRCLRNCQRNESFFCSELVTIIYKKLHILPWYINEEDITPETLLTTRLEVGRFVVKEAKKKYEKTVLEGIVQLPAIYIG